jgi:uncharacterized repeat protein (TIGR03806 family)
VRLEVAASAVPQQFDLYFQARLARIRVDVSGPGSFSATPDYPGSAGHLRLSVVYAGSQPLVVELSVEDTYGGGNTAGIGMIAATLRAAPDHGASSGLDSRPGTTTCLLPDRPALSGVTLEPRFPSLGFSEAVAMLQAPGDASRWYLIEKPGRIHWFDATNNLTNTTSLYLDYTGVVDNLGNSGLLSMAFHPDFPADPRVFLFYVVVNGNGRELVISSMRTTDGNLSLDPSTEEALLTLGQTTHGHKGGHLQFGSDGYLYIGLGDDGLDAIDPDNNGQDTNTLMGSMLRIDVDAGSPYAIPPDNPFAAGGGAPEAYAWGFRSPWRWSFDKPSGRLWLGDVGQALREEVNLVERGGNYGWRCYEGTRLNTNTDTSTCGPATDYTFPVAEVDHIEGRSITGGQVYRGTEIPDLDGVYVFGDFVTGSVWGLYELEAGVWDRRLIANTSLNVAHLALDHDGELYMLGHLGEILRLTADPGAGSAGPSDLLSATGCVDPDDARQPADGLVPYDINVAFWSDGADKNRYLAMPDGSAATPRSDGDVLFPVGTVFVKHFRIDSKLVETRLLTRHGDGGWGGYSYEWNVAETDATLVPAAGKDVDLGPQTWRFPGRGECFQCHTAASNFALGPELRQLNRDITYPGSTPASQLATWHHIGLFDQPVLNGAPQNPLPDPLAQTVSVETRARSYLHANCAQCHQPGGGTESSMDLRFATPLAATLTCDQPPLFEDFGYVDPRILAPGDPGRSVLYRRISQHDADRMPPVATYLVDGDGAALISNWITGLVCP